MRAKILSEGILVFLAAQVWCVVDATGCSCVGPPSVDEARANAEYVFSGRVVSLEAPGPRPVSEADTTKVISSGDMIRYAIVPKEIWKGAAADTLVVYSARWSMSCGFEMKLDGEYLLYAWLGDPARFPDHWEWAKGKPTGPVLMVGLCSRNRALTVAAQDMDELGAPIWRLDKE